MIRPSFDSAGRWKLLFKPRRERRWLLLGTAGSRDQAERWLIRFAGHGDFRLDQPARPEDRVVRGGGDR